jgi:hypothetical protein
VKIKNQFYEKSFLWGFPFSFFYGVFILWFFMGFLFFLFYGFFIFPFFMGFLFLWVFYGFFIFMG